MSSSLSSSSKPQEQEKEQEKELTSASINNASINNDADDLDDLDDVLDEFNKPQGSSSASVPVNSEAHSDTLASGSSAARTASVNSQANNQDDGGNDNDNDADADADADGLDDILSQNFAKELASQMEALMKEIGNNPASAGLDQTDKADGSAAQLNEEELIKQFEAMMAGFGGSVGGGSATGTGIGSTQLDQKQEQHTTNFNDALAATMNRLKESDASATASSSLGSDAFAGLGGGGDSGDMAKLLAALSGADGEEGLDNPELAKMLEGMMDELMSKEILYEPLHELRDKYPAYLEGRESASISSEDRRRYEKQYEHVKEIVAVFEDANYDSKNRGMASKVQDLMNQMQELGSPPKEIVGDMPPELESLTGLGGGAGGAGGEDGECIVM